MKDILAPFILALGVFWLYRIYRAKQTVEGVDVLEVAEYKKALNRLNKPQLIDVRTAAEHEQGHISGSVLIDALRPSFKKSFGEYDKQKPIFVYCRSGNRSQRASKILKRLGFEKVIDLKGGYLAWEEKN